MSVSADRRAHVIASDEEALAIAAELAAEIAPGASARDNERRLPAAELERVGRSGLLAITVPREHGGPAVSHRTLTEVFRTLAVADSSIAHVPQNHFAFVFRVINHGTAAQRAFFLGEVLRGARFGNALSERGTKDIHDYRTRLSGNEAGELRLQGRKYYCTGALTADWIPVFALDDDDELVVPFVARDAEGVEVIDDWSAMGQRGTASGTVVLEDVLVDPEHVVRPPAPGKEPSIGGAFAQQMLAAVAVGIARGALEDAAAFVRTRTRPWIDSELELASEDPHTIYLFGELTVLVEAAEALLVRAADALDAAAAAPSDAELAARASLAVAGAKAYGGEIAVKVASDVFALAGTAAADERHNLHRHWRNVRTLTLHDPARWKYHHIGNHTLNGVRPPVRSLI
jgi:SfnB family sulfur acquisition oxidoreductase